MTCEYCGGQLEKLAEVPGGIWCKCKECGLYTIVKDREAVAR